MLLQNVKSFMKILNTDALLFLGTRLAGIVLSITSVILLCRAVTIQHHFQTGAKGLLHNLVPLGPLAYSLVWSVASAILPGCQRKYHPALDMGFDCLGWLLSFAAGAALLVWSLRDAYSIDSCSLPSDVQACMNAESALSSTEKSGAILLLLTGMTHLVMFVRACIAVSARRKKYVPSRNSWMQLEKESNHSIEIVPLDLNTINFVIAEGQAQPKVGGGDEADHTDSTKVSPV